MADSIANDRLQPCLLDRLTDDDPKNQSESRDRRVISTQRYREAVLRDIVWLLNTARHTEAEDFQEFEEAAKSVLNFGIRDVCGMTIAGLSVEDLEKEMVRSVRIFEPRILPGTLKIRAVVDEDRYDTHGLQFEITGDLWANPIPESLYIKTAVDLETGEYLTGR